MAVSLGPLARALQPHALITCASLQDWGHARGGGSPANQDPQELPGEPGNPSAAAPWQLVSCPELLGILLQDDERLLSHSENFSGFHVLS